MTINYRELLSPIYFSTFHNNFIQTVKWNDQAFIYQSKNNDTQSRVSMAYLFFNTKNQLSSLILIFLSYYFV